MRAAFVPAALALASALVSMSIAASAHADEAEPPAASPAATPVAAAPAAVEVTEARGEIEGAIAQMRATSLRVREQLRMTRRRGSREQITCVDQALSRSDVALRRAREAGDEALASYARSDVESARAARHRLREIKESQRVAAAEGTSCAPAPLRIAQAGTTTVKLEIDPRIAAAP